jgi:long-chain acyl-CoA synthetase
MMNLSMTLRAMALAHPDEPAITWDEGQWNYATFETHVGAIAGHLKNTFGLERGQRVALSMTNCSEFYPMLYGIWRAGLSAVPVNAKLHPRELSWILSDSGAKLVVATPDIAAKMSEFPGEDWPRVLVTDSADFQKLLVGGGITDSTSAPEDEAWLFYTSGTTGRPKGAMLTHRNLLGMIYAYYADIDFLDTRDTMLHAAPLSHGSGLYGLALIAKGGNNVIFPGFETDRIIEALGQFQNVSFFAAPTMVTRLLHDPRCAVDGPANLKTITYGGAPMYVSDLKRGLKMLGPRFFQVYGQGESPMTITGLPKALHGNPSHPRFEMRLASAGLARTGCEFRVVDPSGKDVPSGEVGEIITRSDIVMKGYWDNPDANEATLRDGWLWTGDMGAVDEEGFLTIKDRSKDMIISGGTNIYPREIEELLLTHAGVRECAVIGRPHADWGEEVVAVVVRQEDANADPVSEQTLDQLCLDNIARFKRPKAYVFADSLPKNNYGKILKTELRETLLK